MNPYLIGAALALAVALAGGGYWKGWSDRAARAEIAASAAIVKSQQSAVTELKAATQVADKLEKSDAHEQIVYRTITQAVDRIVEQPVYRDRCLDDGGLRLARAAIAGALTDPAESDAVVPGAATTH